MSKYRVAIMGRTGRGNYGHGLDLPWQQMEACQVVAVADDNPAGLAAAVKRTGAATGYDDYRRMLEQERPQIAVICQRWLDAHHEMALACAEYGCHMYLEKPLCRTLQEADDIVQACEMRHLKMAVAHITRYSPQTRVVKQLIRDGAIGDVLEIRARGKEDPTRGGGEDLWVLGTHMLDLMRALAGDVESCSAFVNEGGGPVTKQHVREGNEAIGPLAGDHVQAHYRFKNGINGYFASRRGMAGSPTRFGLAVYGSKGVIEMQSGYMQPAYLLEDPSWSPGRSGKAWQMISSNGPGRPETIQAQNHAGGNLIAAEDLLSAIEGDRQPVSSMYDARAATEMIVGVFESHRLRRPVSLPLENRQNPLTMLDR